jgi:plastocyanin
MSARALRSAALATAAVAAAAAPAAAATETVTVHARYFTPPRLEIVVGDSVVWRNADHEEHTVVAAGGAFASARLAPQGEFGHSFATGGSHPYLCTLHPLMRGAVEVAAATLAGPGGRVPAGRPVELRGRTAPGGGLVRIEAVGSDGATTAVAEVASADDGTFRATVRPVGATTYRAVAAAGASAPLRLETVVQVGLTLSGTRGPRGLRLTARAVPAQPGAPIALQLYSRERFSWRQVAHARLDGRGAARFRLGARVHRRARVVLRDGRRGPILATSPALRTSTIHLRRASAPQ